MVSIQDMSVSSTALQVTINNSNSLDHFSADECFSDLIHVDNIISAICLEGRWVWLPKVKFGAKRIQIISLVLVINFIPFLKV